MGCPLREGRYYGPQTRAQNWTVFITIPVQGTPLEGCLLRIPSFSLPQVIVLKMEKSFLQLF